jgi:hypothetical protein
MNETNLLLVLHSSFVSWDHAWCACGDGIGIGVWGMYIKINANMYGKYLQIRITGLVSVADPKLFIPDLISTFQIMPDLISTFQIMPDLVPAPDPIIKLGYFKKIIEISKTFSLCSVPTVLVYIANDEYDKFF